MNNSKNSTIQIFAPATVANVACGFDILGFALDEPGDVVEIRRREEKGIFLRDESGYNLPTDPAANTVTVPIIAYLKALKQEELGFKVTVKKKIRPGSGLGSSSASAVAGVFGVNELLGRPLTVHELLPFVMEGEKLASGDAHADNVAPCLLGGFTLIRGYDPLDVVQLPYPEELWCSVVHPHIEVKTSFARSVLKNEIPLKDAIRQWGNVAGLVAGLTLKDIPLIGRSLEDVVVEPVRSALIPGFYDIKRAAVDAGALGCSISGAGPSVFALSVGEERAAKIAEVMRSAVESSGMACDVYVSAISGVGARVVR